MRSPAKITVRSPVAPGTETTRSASVWPPPRPCDGHLTVPQVDDCVVDGVLGRPQCGDRVVDLSGVGSVTQRIVAKLSNIGCEVVQNFRCTEYLSICESSGAQHMIEVLVGQHHMRHSAPGNQAHVVVDRVRFGQRGTGVDQQRSGTALHQTDSDVEKRQPTTMHAVGQGLPFEVHKQSERARDQAP